MTPTPTTKTLKSQRTRLKTQLKRLNEYLDSLNDETKNIGEIKARQSKLEPMLGQFELIQGQLEDIMEQECDEEERSEFENTYFSVHGRFFEILSNSTQIGHDTKQSSNIHATDSHSLRLPRISIPEFSGSYDEWTNFHDTFTSLVDSNSDISEIQKFHYLKAALTGNATDAIRSLAVSAENYSIAWNMLKKRYDNKRLIVENHIKAIFDLPIMQKNNPVPLRSLLDGMMRHTSALTSQGLPVEHWDDWLAYLIKTKMDYLTNQEWESLLPDTTSLPKLETLLNFLNKRCQTLESISRSSGKQVDTRSKHMSHVTTISNCPICTDNHMIYQCTRFRQMTPIQRVEKAKQTHLCTNCLSPKHPTHKCSASSCKICQKRHNTLLHIPSSNNKPQSPESSQESTSTTSHHALNQRATTQIFLSTAIVEIQDIKGRMISSRLLLDSGSQSNFISQNLVDRLGVKPKPFHIPVSGISQCSTHIKSMASIKLKSKYNNFQSNIDCLVIDKITGDLPQTSSAMSHFDIPKNIKLADPNFSISSPIEILIGIDLFWRLMCIGQIKANSKHPCLQKTHLGWIVAGSPSQTENIKGHTLCNLSMVNSLDDKIASFWQLEEIPRTYNLTQEERYCEDHFTTTHTRDQSGRFIVQLPFKHNPQQLGETRSMALKRFYNLEKRLNNDLDLKVQYTAFLTEYYELGHMQAVEFNSSSDYYLPHHAVLKPSSTTTKLRVVFDGSAKSSTGISLNDQLLVGPTIQDDLFSIILRFRTHKIVLTADIAKMYRQILLHEDHRRFQKILWRNDSKNPIQTFQLSTVTYGTASAAYLAIRCLHQLAVEEKDNFPLGSSISLRDFYVDDLITGANTIDEATDIINQTTALLQKGGFELRKWCSNEPSVFNASTISTTADAVHALDKENTKALGLLWNSHDDVLLYKSPQERPSTKVTKRSILAFVASLFDPLGLIGPVVVIGKIIMQKLWQAQLNWDESVTTDIYSQFQTYVQDIQQLSEVTIPRNVLPSTNAGSTEMHGFCDASESAYGACIYIKHTNSIGNTTCNLLCAKSRIAPVRSISLPRLELCGAVLLAELSDRVISKINIGFSRICYWTDSTIVLAWLKVTNKQWKTFVANRVNMIHELTDTAAWNHVRSEENPADIISRGMHISTLVNSKLWWHGPSFLMENLEPNTEVDVPNHIPEERTSTMVMSSTQGIKNTIFTKFSSLTKLIRITAYCMRFILGCRSQHHHKFLKPISSIKPLDIFEINAARNRLVVLAQREFFSIDIRQLKSAGHVSKGSPLISLNPFVDDNGIIRVGGRLSNAAISFSHQHPIVLPSKHILTTMIITYYHRKNLHAGIQGTMAAIRKEYWPIALKSSVRKVIHTCIPCFKAKPVQQSHIMGQLPKSRLQSSRPFLNCGVDYCGPFTIRDNKRRNSKSNKMYVAVFVCMTVKAVHLEIVSDLSTDAFLNALRRFMARRGTVINMYSDNGTNFVGANRELKHLYDLISSNATKDKIFQYTQEQGINWHFIPPKAPHFGGLWEAAVKSLKSHLRKVAGGACLTLETFSTLLIEIEAILNSRPLIPLSNDPNDLSFLSPGHFLIGDTLTSIPCQDLTQIQTNRLTQWQHVQQIKQHFWKRWKNEYLSQLQQRNKWRLSENTMLAQDQLVIIREDNVPPLQWNLGRIVEVHPGEDGIIRAATVRTRGGVFKRPTVKLCVLPIV